MIEPRMASATMHDLALPLLRARLSVRLLEDTILPPYKGGMLRGGFGHAFQRASCPRPCWGAADHCLTANRCPYHAIFETPHPPGVNQLHDLQDVPRPFVIEPPLDHKRQYAAGDTLEFGLVLLGRAIDALPYFLTSFEELGRLGLGRTQARARLERVEALYPWQPTGVVIYQDGRVMADQLGELPTIDGATVTARAAQLPADLRLTLRTPLRVKTNGSYLTGFDLPAITKAICWRLNALATFHGGGPWPVDHRLLVELARSITLEHVDVRWVDWERTSTREPARQQMNLGGIIGSAVLRGVPAELRALLLAGSLVHAGKACVFGHGWYGLAEMTR